MQRLCRVRKEASKAPPSLNAIVISTPRFLQLLYPPNLNVLPTHCAFLYSGKTHALVRCERQTVQAH